LIPVSVDELIEESLACAKAGAAIIHLHAYDEDKGVQNDSLESYAEVIREVRRQCDVIIYPTVAQSPADPDSPARFDPIEGLAESGLLEWSVLDPGSVNFSSYEAIASDTPGYLYTNTDRYIRQGLELARKHRIHPSYAIYEPGFLRLGAALFRRFPGTPMPIYRFMLTDALAFGLPVADYALDALHLLEQEHPGAPWMLAGRCSDISPLIGRTVAAGGHIRVGLEDAPLGAKMRNIEWVGHAAELIQKAGGTLASAKEIRATLTSQN